MLIAPQVFSEILAALRAKQGEGRHSEARRAGRYAMNCRLSTIPLIPGGAVKCLECLVRDISSKGLGIVQSLPMEKGSHLIACLPCNDQLLAYLGKVCFCASLADGIHRVGVEFVKQLHRPDVEKVGKSNDTRVAELIARIPEPAPPPA